MSSDIRRRPEGALLRTYLRAAGIAPESIAKPLIGVVTISTQVFSERPLARDLGVSAAKGVELSGGFAVRWDSSRTPDLMTWGHAEGYSFAWRDQLADLLESWSRQEAVDGLVLVGDSAKTLAGMAMAAARLNIPAIIVTTGSSRWVYRQTADGIAGKRAIADPYDLLSQTLFAKKKTEKGAPEPGADLFNECLLGQDNHSSHAMDLALEALGVTLPGMATAAAQSPRRADLAEASGKRAVWLVQNAYPFRRVLTQNAFHNAIRLSAAMGGSVDVAVHLMALAHEAGVTINVDLFDRIARETPQICHMGGAGEKSSHSLEDLERAGGVWAVLNGLKTQVSPTATLSGKGALELAKTNVIRDPQVIAAHRPFAKHSGIGVLYGNIAPKGAMFLLNQVLPLLANFKGPAAVFESEIEAARAINEGGVKKGSALIVRGQGPRGGPGLRKLRVLPALLLSRGWNKTVPLLTDGRLPDTPAGLFVSSASPEAAVAGPLAVLKNGDMIEFDTANRRVGVRLTDLELRIRISRWQAPEVKTARRGFLERYSRQVSEAHEGAILK